MIVVIFRSRLRDEGREEYAAWGREIGQLASVQPGFVSAKTFTAPDGERVTLAEFETEDDVRAWREHPRHRQAQDLGRATFYSEYHLQVCDVTRAYGWNLTPRPPLRSGEGEHKGKGASRSPERCSSQSLPFSEAERGPGGEV